MSITSIQDLDTRNIVRGLVANKNRPPYVKARTISHALRVCPLKDIVALTRYLIQNDHYDFYFGSTHPKTTSALFFRRSQSISIDKARLIIQTTIMEQRTDVLVLLQSVKNITYNLLSNNFAGVIDCLEEIETTHGKSKFSLRVTSYLISLQNRLSAAQSEHFPDVKLRRLHQAVFDDNTPQTLTIFFNHLLDSSDAEIDPMDFIIANFNSISNISHHDHTKKIYFKLLCSALFPTVDVEIGNDSTTADLCFSSLLDMVMYSCAIYGSDHVYNLCDGSTTADPHEIMRPSQPSQSCFEISDECIEQSVKMLQYENLDVSAYRLSNVLFPYEGVRNWRAAIDRQVLLRCQSDYPIIKTIDCSEIYPQDLKLHQLSKPPTAENIKLRTFDNSSAGVFARTFAALELIDRGQTLSEMKPSDLRLLLNQTTSLAQLLSRDELEELKSFGNVGENLVISFLALVMLHDRLGDQDTAFDLRSTFEDVLTQQFRGDFTEFLKWLNQRTPALCHRIAQVCDIDFLERLYHLMDTFDDVIEAREKICRWMADTFDDDSYRQFADRLSLDARIRRIRGEIDDSRIYVDQIRFRQHVTRHIAQLFRKHQRGYIPSSTMTTGAVSGQERPDKETIIKVNFGGPHYFWVDRACDDAFGAFCLDPIFGVNSYLSRRIRHGTLRGFLIAPVKKILDAKRYERLWEDPDIARDLNKWFAQLGDTIAFLRDEYFHFRSADKPKGAFDPNPIGNEERIRVRRDYYKRIDEFCATGFTHTEISLTLYDHCWNVIQTDLLRIANDVPNLFRSRLRAGLPRLPYSDASLVVLHRQMLSELDQTLEGLFSQLAGWFTEPEISSLTVSVRDISDAVVVEMREYYPEFSSAVHHQGEFEARLTGNIYQNIYDILKIFVENIVVHGDASKPVTIDSIFVKGERHDHICIEIKSSLRDGQVADDVHTSIRKALAPESALKAMVREGMSGLGKVLAIVQTAETSPGTLEWKIEEREISFFVSLPMVVVALE